MRKMTWAIILLLVCGVVSAEEDKQVIEEGQDIITIEGNKITIVGHPSEKERAENESLTKQRFEKLRYQERQELAEKNFREFQAKAIAVRSNWTSSGGDTNCEDVCDSGYDACVSECPSSVHDNNSGGDFNNTDAQDQCKNACSAGKNACESECLNSGDTILNLPD